jgi:hypothetical protein
LNTCIFFKDGSVEIIYLLRDKSYLAGLYHVSGEGIKICQTCSNHRKSPHIFTIWQQLSLITFRQYKGKSYRMFMEWFGKSLLSYDVPQDICRIPHFTTLQKFTDRIAGTILSRIISSFIVILINIKRIFFGIDSSGFKSTGSSQYYIERAKLRRKWIKLSIGADV